MQIIEIVTWMRKHFAKYRIYLHLELTLWKIVLMKNLGKNVHIKKQHAVHVCFSKKNYTMFI